jgi:hypothetical protein
MQTARKITSVIVMVLSILLLVVMLAGAIGIWFVRAPAIQLVTDVSTTADNIATRALEILVVVDTTIARGQATLDEAVSAVEAGGEQINQTSLALVALERLFDTDLDPAIERLTTLVSDVRSTVTLLHGSVRLVQLIPSNRDRKLIDTADQLLTQIKQVGQSVADARQAVKDAKASAVNRAVTTVTDPLTRASERLSTTSGNLSALQTTIAEEQARLRVLTQQIITGITLAVIVLCLGFLWAAFAQVALFVHAYGVYTGRDPLARWHDRKPEAQANAEVQPAA